MVDDVKSALETLMVAFEGGDAVGKNTQSKLLAQRIGATLFSSPDYSTPTGQEIAKTWDNMLVRQALFAANRYESARKVLDALAKGPVVHDRYMLSSVIFGTVEGLDEKWLWEVQSFLPQPRIHILIDLAVDEGFRRRPERRDANERSREKQQAVRREYLQVFSKKGPERKLTTTVRGEGAVPVQFLIVDGNGTLEQVHERVWEALCSTLSIS
jgi:dTMP kinase